MAIQIQVIDSSQGPSSTLTHDMELPAVPRVGDSLVFYTDNGGEHIITVQKVLWLVNSGEELVQIRAW